MLARVDPPQFLVPRSAQPNPDLARGGASARRLTAMGVEIGPTPLAPAERVLRELFAGTFLTYRDVFGEAVALATVLDWIRRLPAEAVLVVCSVLSRYASLHSERERSQKLLAEWALSPLYVPDVVAMLAGGAAAPRQMLFHHEQLLLAAKLAILHGGDGLAAVDDIGQRHQVGRILLAVNDLLLNTGRNVAPESDEILGLVVRSLAVNTSEEPRLQIARAYDMFVERGATEPDIGRFFRDEFGVDLTAFMAFGLFCSLPFNPLVTPQPPQLSVAALVRNGHFVPSRVRLHPEWQPTLDLLAAPREWFREQLDDGEVAASTFYPFQLRPYYRTTDGAIFPINNRFVLDRIGIEMLWMLHDAQRGKGGRSVQTFMGTVGTVCIEPHCIEALRDATPTGSGQRFIAGTEVPDYASPGFGMVKGSDAYVVDHRRLVVVEITGSGIPIKALLSGDGALFRDEFEKKMVLEVTPSGKRKVGKLGQLDRVVRDLLAGHLVLPNVDLADIDTIYPVLLNLQPIPQLANIGLVVKNMLTKHGMFAFPPARATVAPLRVINLEELEIIAGDLAADRIRLADVLQPWIDDGLGHDSGLKNHLLRYGYQERDNPRIHATYDRWAAAARHTLVESGLLDDETPTSIAAE